MNTTGLESFRITNLFGEFNVDLSFESPVNIFLGENGMGKTTILNCLYFVLSGNLEKLIDISFDEIDIKFSGQSIFNISHNDIIAYVEEYRFGSRRRKFPIDNFITNKDLEIIQNSLVVDEESDVINKYVYKLADIMGMPNSYARQEIERLLILAKKSANNGNFQKVIDFKKKVEDNLNDEILYFPTYRRIEEDISRLGIDIDKDKVRNKLIQFGMTDVESSIKRVLANIKTAAITGLTQMTGVLLKQYVNDNLDEETSDIDIDMLSIALDRIGEGIIENEKVKIVEMVKNSSIYEPENKYLLVLLENIIKSYEAQRIYDEKVKKFVQVCNCYLNDKKYIYDESKVTLGIFREKKMTPISISSLSSGEKQVISIFSKLYLEKEEKCIILFDEPELSLSIKWQSNFLPDIMKSEKCSMLIAVTHSPFIFDNEYDHLATAMSDCLSIL